MKTFITLIIFIASITQASAQRTVGLLKRTAESEDGYVLFAPLFSRFTYLIDKCGKEVHAWQSSYRPGNSAYLLEDGSLLRPGNSGNSVFGSGSPGGIIERVDWNNNMLWSYTISSGTECQHHDVCMLPNGNVLALVWERKTRQEAIAAGRDSTKLGAAMWAEKLVELRPTGPTTADVVWQWNVWDHLIQDINPSLPNYGVVADHPELVNINHPSSNPNNPDWLHMNSVAYNADLDEIMLSCYMFNEIWVVDHSTSTSEGPTHSGGRRNKGGDLLYRWGNPQAYGRGSAVDRKFFAQHNAHWIPKGRPDAGKIMVYNNGQSRPDGDYSTVVVIDPPVDSLGAYAINAHDAFAPQNSHWEYKDPNPANFYSAIISGAERLANGNTLICEGTSGRLFEVDSAGKTVWNYVSPVSGITGPVKQGEVAQQNYVFRCTQYAANYAGLSGQTLQPGPPIEREPTSYDCLLDPAPTSVTQASLQQYGFWAVNPFVNSIQLTAGRSVEPVHATLVNALGQICASWQLYMEKGKAANLEAPPSLQPGIYVLRVNDGHAETSLRLRRD